MTLASLQEVPKTQQDWDNWSFSHRTQHDKILIAIQSQLGKNLTSYIIDPVDVEKPSVFLMNNKNLHDDMNMALGGIGSDLSSVDFSNEQQKQNWIAEHYIEHLSISQVLKI